MFGRKCGFGYRNKLCLYPAEFEIPIRDKSDPKNDKIIFRCIQHYCTIHNRSLEECNKRLRKCNPHKPCQNIIDHPIFCGFAKSKMRNDYNSTVLSIVRCGLHSECINCKKTKSTFDMKRKRCRKCCIRCKKDTDTTKERLCSRHKG